MAESERRFRAMFDSSIDGIVVAGHERMVLANPAFARLLGRDPRRIPLDIVNAPIDSFVHPEERQRLVSLHRRRLAGEEFESTYEIRLLRQDEQTVLAEFHVSRFLVRDVSKALKSLNYNPITVSNGEDALDRIQEGGDTLSAIITDLQASRPG